MYHAEYGLFRAGVWMFLKRVILRPYLLPFSLGMTMSGFIHQKIEALVNLETEAWDSKNPDLFLSIIHPDMVWPWPPTTDAHDPVDWVFVMGRFDAERWRRVWQSLFDTHNLIHNNRTIVKILVSNEEDGALAVVDIDTLWQHTKTKEYFHWKGRVGL